MEMYKFRSSAIGQIMSEPRNKADKEAGLLSETAKTYCQQLYREKKYNRRKGLVNKYVEKGIYNEEEAITMLSELDKVFYRKNEKHFDNGIIMGTPDILNAEPVIDIKCSFDLWTFPFTDDKINPMYYWQLQAYMELTGKETAVLAYVLTDTPAFMVKRELSQLMYKIGVNPDDSEEKLTEMYRRVEREMKFEDIPLNERICKFDIHKNPADIARIYSQVEKCRNYLANLK